MKSILESIEKASGRESETEWERIADSLKQCDDEILKLRQENNELKKEVERLEEFEFMYKGLDK